MGLSYTMCAMIIPTQPTFNVTNTAEYRETYANSVQVRVNVWDFFLVFGTMQLGAGRDFAAERLLLREHIWRDQA